MVWAHCLVVQSMCSAVLTVYKFLFVKLLLSLKGYSRKKTNSGGLGGGVEDMELRGGLKK